MFSKPNVKAPKIPFVPPKAPEPTKATAAPTLSSGVSDVITPVAPGQDQLLSALRKKNQAPRMLLGG